MKATVTLNASTGKSVVRLSPDSEAERAVLAILGAGSVVDIDANIRLGAYLATYSDERVLITMAPKEKNTHGSSTG